MSNSSKLSTTSSGPYIYDPINNVIYNSSDYWVDSNKKATISDSNKTINLGDNDTLYLTGNNNSVYTGRNDTIFLSGGSSVTTFNTTITAVDHTHTNTTITVTGGNNNINLGDNRALNLTGDNNTVTSGKNDTINLIGYAKIFVSDVQNITTTSGGNYIIAGNNDSISLATNSNLTIGLGNMNITGSSNDTLSLAGLYNPIGYANNNTRVDFRDHVIVMYNNGNGTIDYTHNNVSYHDTFSNITSFSNAETINLVANSGGTLNDSWGTINFNGKNNLSLNGSHDIINMDSHGNGTLTLTGSSNTVNNLNGNVLTLQDNSEATISATNLGNGGPPHGIVHLSNNDTLHVGLGNFGFASNSTGNVLDFSAIHDNTTISTDNARHATYISYTDNGIQYTDAFSVLDHVSIINATLDVAAGTTQTVTNNIYSTFNLGADTNLTVSPHTLRDTFNLAQNFDKVSITGFGVNDYMSLNSKDFADWTTLLKDASASANGLDTVITRTSKAETITLANMNLTTFTAMDKTHFHFV